MQYASYELIHTDLIPAIVRIGDAATPVWHQAKWSEGEYQEFVRKNGCGHCCAAMALCLHGIDIDVRQVPDLVPILCIAAGAAEGTTRILNAARLRIKESDRLCAMANALTVLGVSVEELPDGLVIEGRGSFTGGTVDSVRDHRIAMSAAVAAIKANAPVTILDAHSAEKSYPHFYQDYQALGGKLHVL